jgi:hypothetical protein
MMSAVPIDYRDSVLQEMRDMVDRGTDVRELVTYLQKELGFGPVSIIPYMAYFRQAFSVPLDVVLPLREWIGTDNDQEINDLLMPKIAAAKSRWPQPVR